jgi:uncharacterized membrane protein YeaQ/YmgE (transglycosylase-associated protein family)
MGIIAWLLLGLIAGLIAKAVHRGERDPGGIIGTMAVGVVGALVGGFIASRLGLGSIDSFFSVGTWLIAIGGALLLLVVFNLGRAPHARLGTPERTVLSVHGFGSSRAPSPWSRAQRLGCAPTLEIRQSEQHPGLSCGAA